MAREELKTIEGWHKSGCNSWDEYCKPGDMVDQGVADYFLDILPPRTKTMKNCDTYATCEVGYPSQKEELLMPYIEDPTEPTKAVYPYVPVEVIEQVIEKHGGWFDARIPFA